MSELRNVLSALTFLANSPVRALADSIEPAEWVAHRSLEWRNPHCQEAIG